MSRKFIKPIKRVVIKVGSSVLATYQMKPKTTHLASLVEQICTLQQKGIEVILVSSGAIVLGMGELNFTKRPADLASLQALAAVGQTVLMRIYSDLFKKYNSRCAQVLLTWEDFNNRVRFNNAHNTFDAILSQGVVPVVNENDTISTDEIKFGDNDKLSALVASLIQADLLLILSDVEGLMDLKSDNKKVFEEIKEITDEIRAIAGDTTKKEVSKGGMSAKLEAIKIASHARIPSIITNGEIEDVLLRVVSGERLGTLFMEKEEKLLARKHWIFFGAKPKGIIVVDDGAKEALLKGGRSLLLPGIVSWKNDFKADDVVIIEDQSGEEIARGISGYSSGELHKSMEDKKGKREVVHCDNMVIRNR